MKVISLGWGVQSFALAAMSALGVLPPVDAAIHADTTHERSETYAFAEKWTPWLEARGVRVVTVKAKYTRPDTNYSKGKGVRIPAHTKNLVTGAVGKTSRKCTRDWKIAPIRKFISLELKARGISKRPGVVEQWRGITLDEIQRMKPNDVKYIIVHYPFIQQFNPPMSRWQVIQWLQDNDLEIPVKSSCMFCPLHNHTTWHEIKMGNNGDWQRAIEVDDAIRQARPGHLCYLHNSAMPLTIVDLRSEADHGQLSLWDEECEGMCFL